MKIARPKHRGIRRLIKDRGASGLPAPSVDKIRKILAFLQNMGDVNELYDLPHWKPHRLKGNREEVWSLSVTGNYRITFRVNRVRGEIVDLDFEDYH